jgi:predicted RNA polymerase sigma factor
MEAKGDDGTLITAICCFSSQAQPDATNRFTSSERGLTALAPKATYRSQADRPWRRAASCKEQPPVPGLTCQLVTHPERHAVVALIDWNASREK